MSSESVGFDVSASYVAGLLDATGRVRFQLSDTGDDQYTVRPSLRIFPSDTRVREAVVGRFLDREEYDYQLFDRDSGADYFGISRISELERLQEFLRGHSAQLVRELEFVTTVFKTEFGNRILSPKEAYRFLLTRDELRYGWQPRAPRLTRPSDVEAEHEFDPDDVSTPTLPEGSFRESYSLDYVAGFFDGRCRYRPSIAESDRHATGYVIYPTARIHRNGVSEAVVELFREFRDDYDLRVGDSSSDHQLWFVFTGAGPIRRVLELIFPRLIVAAEYSAFLDEVVLPRFDADDHLTKKGFLETLSLMEEVAVESGGHYSPDQYTSDYFADLWSGEVDLEAVDPMAGERTRSAEGPSPPAGAEAITVTPEAYRDAPGRYQTVVSRHERDGEPVQSLKALYADRCQLCGDRRARPDGTGYSEVHHVRPLGAPHEGPDERANMVVVCPNHHADFDNGVLTVDPETLEISHPYDRSVDGRTLTVADGHEIDAAQLAYHDERIATHSEGTPE